MIDKSNMNLEARRIRFVRNPTCSVDACGKDVKGRGLCGMHYARVLNLEKKYPHLITPKVPKPVLFCSVDGCGRIAKTRILCSMHYHRLQRHGDPLGGHKFQGAPRAFMEKALAYDGDECLIWPYAFSTRPTISIKHKNYLVTRIVCEESYGAAPTPKHQAAHSCKNRDERCITPRHLRWATKKENEADKIRHGTKIFGAKVHNAVLTDEDAIAIRKRYAQGGISQRALGRLFGVSQYPIRRIVTGKGWSLLWTSKNTSD